MADFFSGFDQPSFDVNKLTSGDRAVSTPAKKKGGIQGFLGNVVDSVVTPAAKFVNQGLVQAGGVYDTARMLAAQASNNTEAYKNADKAAKNRYKQYGDTGGLFNKGTITNEEESKKGDLATGIKKIGGTTAQIGATIAPVAKGAGILANATNFAKSGAVYGAGESLANNGSLTDATEAALKGAAVGGATGGVLGTASGVLSKIKPAGKQLEKYGNDLMGTQANLTRAEGRRIGSLPSDVIGAIKRRTGISNLDTAAAVAKNVTGDTGAYSELVRNAIGNSPGVNISDLRKVADDLLVDKAPLIAGSQRKNVMEQIKNSVVGAYGGSEGSLSTLANPLDAFAVSKSFRSMAKDIKTSPTVSAADKQLAAVYDNLAGTIEDRLYKSPGVSEGIKLAAPDRAKDLRFLATSTQNKAEAKAYNKLADELDQLGKSGDIKAARSLQKDFVDLMKIDQATATATSGAGARVGNQMQGVGKLVQRPTNLLAVPLDAATPKIGGLLSSVGQKMSQTTTSSVPNGVGILSKYGVRQAANAGASTPNTMEQQPDASNEDTNQLEDTSQPTYLDEISAQNSQYVSGNESPFSPTNVEKSVKNILAQGGTFADVEKYLSIVDSMYKITNPTGTTKLTAAQETRAAAAQNALRDIPMIQEAIKSGKLGGLKSLPGSGTALGSKLLGTEDLDAALFNIADNILRARSGANAPEAEIKRFVSNFLPRPTDSEKSKNEKLARAVRELEGYVNPVQTLE